MLFQDKYTFKIQKQTTFKANMRENVIEFSIYELHPRAMPRVNYCLHFKKSQDLKVLGFFAKLYPRVLGLVATPDPRVIFIILIITLNLVNPYHKSVWTAIPDPIALDVGLAARSCHKSVIIK